MKIRLLVDAAGAPIELTGTSRDDLVRAGHILLDIAAHHPDDRFMVTGDGDRLGCRYGDIQRIELEVTR